MAAINGIHGDPIGALKHDLRERLTYKNEDIDPGRSHLNYLIESHCNGRTSGESYSYYLNLTDGVYHRGKSTICTVEIVYPAPVDLAKGKERDFFKSSADFTRKFLFDGRSDRELLAVVHLDEAKNGASGGHMHYIFALPEVRNEQYISEKDKFLKGLKWVEEKTDLDMTDEQKAALARVVIKYDRDFDINEAIHDTADILSIGRDYARKVLLHIKRTNKESKEKRLMSKDEFLTRQVFRDFHPAYQKWMDEHGFDCTVYQGGGTINIPVEQLKEMTRETGATLDHGLTPKELGELLNMRNREVKRGSDVWGRERKRGDDLWKR